MFVTLASSIFFLLCTVQGISSAPMAEWHRDIFQGTCSGDKLLDEDVNKLPEPYTIKRLKYTWIGSNAFRITCIRITNKMLSDDKSASVRMVNGGVGFTSVVLEMLTERGAGMDFHLLIYGEGIDRRPTKSN